MTTPAIVVDHLTVVRGRTTALADVSTTMLPGLVTGLLGPSGCGKSTLIRSVVGVQRTTSGTVTVFGRPAGSAALRARIGYMTQAPSVYDDLTVRQNLRYLAAVLGVPGTRVDDVLRDVALTEQAGSLVADLSGGQRSRVSLAAALIGRPDLLVLDEPTVGLDPVLRRDLWQVFHGLAADGTTLLVSSHVMDEADRCDRLLMLRDGRLLADGTPQGLREQTGRTDLEAAFLALIDRAEVTA